MDSKPDKGDILKKQQSKIRKQFDYLKKTKDIGAEISLAQAKEICDYFNRLIVAPFPAWEAFLYKSINIDKEEFLYQFYVRENEFGVLEPDHVRINRMRKKE